MTGARTQDDAGPGPTIPEKMGLQDILDEQLERYLNLMNEYQILQQDLATVLSSGHLSLAQANFTNPNRIRYGQDFYDGRMQASIRFNTGSPAEQPPGCNPMLKNTSSVTTLPSTTRNTDFERADATNDYAATAKESDAEIRIVDPLRWFGILVPPALRACQISFKHAVEELVPSLTNISNEMKSLEIEIRRTRKKIRKAG